jgi:hypothetical protein
MTDRYKVYTKVLKVLKEMLTLSHPGHVLTLAMLIAGIVTGRNAQLSSVSAETATKAKDKSTEMRLRRWVKHESIDVDVVYMPFAKQVLEALSALPLFLVMDGSQVGRGCMVLMVSVLYQTRPLNVISKRLPKLCRSFLRRPGSLYWVMPSTTQPKCCSGSKNRSAGTLFCGPRRKFMYKKAHKASQLALIGWQKDKFSSITRLVLPRKQRCV